MKKNNILIVVFAVTLLIVFISFRGDTKNGEVDDPVEGEEVEVVEDEEGEVVEAEEGDSRLDMQGYFLDIPAEYECTGGLTQGYRYLDAECIPEEGDYKIISERGLAATVVAGDSFASMYSSLLSHDIDGICYPLVDTEEIELDAEHYVCEHVEDDKNLLTVGIGRLFHDNHFASHFKVHLQRELGSDMEEGDFDRLVSFMNKAIDIDWSIYEEN